MTDDQFDRKPTLEESAQITLEDLEFDKKIQSAIAEYQRTHKNVTVLEALERYVRYLQGKR